MYMENISILENLNKKKIKFCRDDYVCGCGCERNTERERERERECIRFYYSILFFIFFITLMLNNQSLGWLSLTIEVTAYKNSSCTTSRFTSHKSSK